jgi:hypothetical protein
MPRVFAWLLVGAALVVGYSYFRNHPSQSKARSTDQSQEAESKPDPQGPIQPNTIVSPLEVLMGKAEGKLEPKEEPRQPWKAHPNDHIAPSPVGTTSSIVHKTFAVTSSAKFLFEVPPHAASPQLHGTYHSFARNPGIDQDGDVDLLLMNDQQYADFLHGNPADVVYSVDSSHDQDVSLGLPATLDRPVQYYLVFRNSSNSPGKKLVQADFRIDF